MKGLTQQFPGYHLDIHDLFHAEPLKFSVDKMVPQLHLDGIRFSVEREKHIVFVPAFFCQLIVATFKKLNVSLSGS